MNPKVRTVYRLYVVYCFFIASVKLGAAGLGLYAFLVIVPQLEDPAAQAVLTAVGLGVAIAATPLGLIDLCIWRWRKGEKAWAVHYTNIYFGLPTCIATPLSAPLVVLWKKPSFKKAMIDGKAHSSTDLINPSI